MRKAILAAAVCAAFAAPAASADAPERVFIDWSSSRIIPAGPGACPFAIHVRSEGDIRDVFFADGRFTRHLSDFHVTWTNVETGQTLETVLAGPLIAEPNGDGTYTVRVPGNDGNFVEPGEGPVFSQVGQIVYTADANLNPIDVQAVHGRYDAALFPTICAGLT
jgi:hypothetical protein